jgi:hypothetical protein
MALAGTGFHDSVSYKIVGDSGITTAAAATNVTTSSGRLFSVQLDATKSNSDFYLKIFDGAAPTVGSSVPQLVLRGEALKKQTYEIPFGFAFTELNFWATANPRQTDTAAPVSSVGVRLVCS